MLSLRLPALLLILGVTPAHGQVAEAPAILTVPAQSADPVDTVMAAYRDRTQLIRPCPRGPSTDIIVCGRWLGENARARLPLPVEPGDSAGIARGEVPTANASYGKSGGCSVVGGQTTGCTGSFDGPAAIGVIIKGITALIDPDGDYSPPPVLPQTYKGAGRH